MSNNTIGNVKKVSFICAIIHALKLIPAEIFPLLMHSLVTAISSLDICSTQPHGHFFDHFSITCCGIDPNCRNRNHIFMNDFNIILFTILVFSHISLLLYLGQLSQHPSPCLTCLHGESLSLLISHFLHPPHLY